MPTYVVNLEGSSRTSVSDFLSDPALRPVFSDPETRISELIRCRGIVHYTRSGIRTVVTNGSFEMQSGDFLVVATACPTGEESTFTGNLSRKDHTFIMPDNTEDPFALEAENYFSLRPNTNLISFRLDTLDRLMETIYADDDVDCPINDIIIVSHANESGMYFPVDSRDTDSFLDYDELWDYIDSGSGPQISSRTIQDNAHVHFRGCTVGRDTRFLTKFRELYGNQITVTAPKHLDSFGHRIDTTTEDGEVIEETMHNFEYMAYCFTVFNKTRLSNKNAVIRLFQDKQFTDIHGTEITRAKYNSWIPSNVNQSSRTRHRCDVPITGVTVSRDYRHRLRTIMNTGITYEDESDLPTGAANRLSELRSNLSQDETMQSSYEYPVYERWGYTSFDSFWDGLNWSTPQWDADNLELSSTGTRHEYELRVPITGPTATDNNLMINAFLDPGRGQEATYLHHDIIETDTRFFGIIP
jgi:hypothetical protein